MNMDHDELPVGRINIKFIIPNYTSGGITPLRVLAVADLISTIM